MQSNNEQRISEIIREQIDSFEFRKPYIIKGHESLVSNEISYDQAINDAISQQILDSESNDFIEDLTELGMAAHYVYITSRGIHIRPINPNAMHAVMPAVIGGLKHDIVIADEISLSKMKEPLFKTINEDFFREEIQPKENHPYGWYRKFEKKRF